MSESQAWKAKHLWFIALHAAHPWARGPEEGLPGPKQLRKKLKQLAIPGTGTASP